MADITSEIIIIGAGVVGLAIGKVLSEKNKEILILEELHKFGQISSSRNSGVIHAGIYYPENSLKSKMCIEGNNLLYEYCKKHLIPHHNTKKILVASSNDQIKTIDSIKKKAEKNGIQKIKKISKTQVSILEPLIKCEEALLVNSSGIIDTHGFMNSLEGDIKDSKGMIAYNSKVIKIRYNGKIFNLEVVDKEGNINFISCKQLINSAGLFATDVAHLIEELDKNFIPKTYYAKGNYFSINKDIGIRHLIYPVPEDFGLGVHLTLEMNKTIKFGPDVEWVENNKDYAVNKNKKEFFVSEILKYLPSLDVSLLNPSYSGIRPIMNKKDKSMRDFIINSEKDHNLPGLINLFGIESPGLTSSLSLAKYIANNYF